MKKIWEDLIKKYGDKFYWGYWNSEEYMEELNFELT